MDLVNLVISPVVQSLMVPVKKHLGFLFSSTKYVKDMKEKMEQLSLTEQDIRHNWDEAVARNHEVSHHVSPWLEKVQKMNEKAQGIPTGEIGCFNVAKRYKAGKQSYNILEEIQTLETWKSKIVFTKAQIPLAEDICIHYCAGIEEVISSRDDEYEENTSTSSQEITTFFPCLETLKLHSLKHLNRVDGGDTRSRSDTISSQSSQVIGAFWSLYQYPRKISIQNCDALSRLVPWCAVRQMNRLEGLSVMNCETMMEVFESEPNVDEGSAHVSTSLTCSTLKNITIVVPQLSNLKSVHIVGCDLLSHVFTFSTLESLKNLKYLSVAYCNAIQVIVKEENGTSFENVVFPRLEKLALDCLPNLKGFFLGMNEFRWPLLDYVRINDCPQLMMFTSGESKTPKLKYICTSLGKHSLECGLNFHGTINEPQTTFPSSSVPTFTKGIPWSFHNLIEIELNSYIYIETIIPSHALLHLQKLQKISIKLRPWIMEVFEVVALEGSGFNQSQTVVKIPNLTQVKLKHLDDMKYLWKSNQWMVLEFPNLTTVSISDCRSLEHVFTCSMVGSLVQLQDLFIRDCKNLEVIVKEEECDGKVNKIMLPHLKSLALFRLPNLKGFCPAVTVFTKEYLCTPELKGYEF
ncbi:hypothetical protein L1987_88070 [Smallanthus sonchifolius]|nr:hypothetical protein L1987_88070 [Smallanthus sonchifolius]